MENQEVVFPKSSILIHVPVCPSVTNEFLKNTWKWRPGFACANAVLAGPALAPWDGLGHMSIVCGEPASITVPSFIIDDQKSPSKLSSGTKKRDQEWALRISPQSPDQTSQTSTLCTNCWESLSEVFLHWHPNTFYPKGCQVGRPCPSWPYSHLATSLLLPASQTPPTLEDSAHIPHLPTLNFPYWAFSGQNHRELEQGKLESTAFTSPSSQMIRADILYYVQTLCKVLYKE